MGHVRILTPVAAGSFSLGAHGEDKGASHVIGTWWAVEVRVCRRFPGSAGLASVPDRLVGGALWVGAQRGKVRRQILCSSLQGHGA